MRVQRKLTWWRGIAAAVILMLVLLLVAVAFNLATTLDSDPSSDAPQTLSLSREVAT